MLYRIQTQSDKLRLFTEVYSLSKIPYFTVREMKRWYPDKNFIIIGEIGSPAHASADGDRLYVEEGKIIPILPRGSLRRLFEWVRGYAAVQDNCYVAVIGGLFCLFWRIRCVLKRVMRGFRYDR